MMEPGQNERIGRTLLLWATVIGMAFEVLQPLIAMTQGDPSEIFSLNAIMVQLISVLFRLSLLILLFLNVFQGRTWARIVLGALYILGAMNQAWNVVQTMSADPAAALDATAMAAFAVFLVLGVLLLAAAPIRAYMASVRGRKEP